MAWELLVLAGMLEIVWALALKQADGFAKPWPSLIGVAAVSLIPPGLTPKHLPVGTTYAIWVGIGIFGVAVFGMLALGEHTSAVKLLFLSLIMIDVTGLRVIEG